MQTVNLQQKFSTITDYWQPRIAGEINDAYVKLVKFKGDFVWHKHNNEDEMFLVVKGEFTMKLRDGDQKVREGEFFIVPRGVEHCPSAENEVSVMLLEPKSTLNTGDVRNERTREKLERI